MVRPLLVFGQSSGLSMASVLFHSRRLSGQARTSLSATRRAKSGAYAGLPLGSLHPRGETRLLTAPLDQLMRLRHNPFFGYIEQRMNTEIDAAYGRGAKAVD